ncbi:hypothetical protein BN137_3776 [Cronobacter condimenti 1330]|uniref:Hok/Gef family protein n=1 Tax=Cronobacter condimenti 1330 TaxID=1073999 RepID=K8A379_9ENTR|nr:hypothetical protein BN137_3776 [Cronobacter condimenti 1330]
MKGNAFIGSVIIVCLPAFMLTRLSRETRCALRLQGAGIKVVASLAYQSSE